MVAFGKREKSWDRQDTITWWGVNPKTNEELRIVSIALGNTFTVNVMRMEGKVNGYPKWVSIANAQLPTEDSVNVLVNHFLPE